MNGYFFSIFLSTFVLEDVALASSIGLVSSGKLDFANAFMACFLGRLSCIEVQNRKLSNVFKEISEVAFKNEAFSDLHLLHCHFARDSRDKTSYLFRCRLSPVFFSTIYWTHYYQCRDLGRLRTLCWKILKFHFYGPLDSDSAGIFDRPADFKIAVSKTSRSLE
jgi:hypothetical protein